MNFFQRCLIALHAAMFAVATAALVWSIVSIFFGSPIIVVPCIGFMWFVSFALIASDVCELKKVATKKPQQ